MNYSDGKNLYDDFSDFYQDEADSTDKNEDQDEESRPNEAIYGKYGTLDEPDSILSKSQFLFVRAGISTGSQIKS